MLTDVTGHSLDAAKYNSKSQMGRLPPINMPTAFGIMVKKTSTKRKPAPPSSPLRTLDQSTNVQVRNLSQPNVLNAVAQRRTLARNAGTVRPASSLPPA
jgi:hypothetical protein